MIAVNDSFVGGLHLKKVMTLHIYNDNELLEKPHDHYEV